MGKAPQRIREQQKPYGGKARYIVYVMAGLFGIVCSIILLFVLFFVGVLVSLGCALVFSTVHSKSKKNQFLLNVGKIFFWSAFISILVLFILFFLAILSLLGSDESVLHISTMFSLLATRGM
jgi:energy-coupling factor transporter transmembrane protein EcfT